MRIDDIIYVICLLGCIGAGEFVRKIRDETQRKLIMTGLGFLMVFIVSGVHGVHCIISVLLGTMTLLKVHPSQSHLVTFVVMFGYLTFFRLVHLFGLPSPPGPTNMIQMLLTLKIAGIAFERTAAWKKLQVQKCDEDEFIAPPAISDYDIELQSIDIIDVMHYSFNYIGILTGPYYRYRTYRDYFDMPFKNYAPTYAITIEKVMYASLYCVLYLIADYIWPIEYALSDVFYEERSFLYRLMYVWPTFFVFRMRMYTGLTLSECVCTMAGFGAYPDQAQAINGGGPDKPYDHLKRNAEKHNYNFTTIVNTRVKDVETCWTFREAMKHWNICIQYWLAVNVYKQFPNKKFRTAATMLCSAYWHGFRPGHYFCIMGAAFYVPLEDIWNSLIRKKLTGTKRKIIDVVFWIAKFFAFSYLGIAFLLVSFQNLWKFYSSVYHIGYVTWAVMIAVGLYLTKTKATKS